MRSGSVPSNYRLLRANIVLNGVEDRITTYQLAFGAESNTTVMFELSPDNSGDHRVRSGSGEGLFSEPTRKTVEIASTRYDDIVPALDPATTLLWLEAQGVEGLILQGATKVVDARAPVLIEFAPYLVERSGSREALERAALHYGRCLDVFRQGSAPEPMSRAVLHEIWERLGTRVRNDLLLY
jgi:FkbM family methyltransferase